LPVNPPSQPPAEAPSGQEKTTPLVAIQIGLP